MCFAAGLELALACGLIIAAEGATFAQVEAKIGAATFLGGVYRLAERCGSARAREIVFGADTYDAATFERWNIINRVIPDGDLREAALAWAQQLAKGRPWRTRWPNDSCGTRSITAPGKRTGTSSTSRLICSKAVTCGTRSTCC